MSKSWVKERAEQAGQLEAYCEDLEKKLDTAIAGLSDISRGCVPKGWTSSAAWGYQRVAAEALIKIARMQERRKPMLYWSERP